MPPPRSLRSVLLLTCLLSYALIARSQAPPSNASAPSPDQPGYTIHAGTRLVLTDVTVTDRNGNPVQNLPCAAFHIFDGNAPQQIASCEEHAAVPTSPAADTSASRASKGLYSNDFLLHAPPVLNILVLDITNLALEDQMYLSYELTRFLNRMPSGETLAIYERGGPVSVLLQSFTSDRDLLLAAVHRALPRFPPRGAIYLSDLDTLQQLTTYLGELPGRKNVLWFSGGFPLSLQPDPTQAVLAQFRDPAVTRRVYDALEVSRIAVYPIDARGLTLGSTRGLFEQHVVMNDVAEATGGRAFYNTNGLDLAAAKITSAGEDFYSLTFSPRDYKQDKKWHKVRVTLDGAHYNLSYRRGYFADDVNNRPPSAHSVTHLFAGGSTGIEKPSEHTTSIIFQARVLPTADPANSSAPEVDTSDTPPIPGPKQKKGAVPYSIRYLVPADTLTVTAASTGQSTMHVLIGAFAFNQEGSIVDRHLQRVVLTVDTERLKRNPHVDLPLNLQLQLAKGEIYLMLAVVDESSGRSGNLQIAMQVAAPPKR